MSEGEGDWRVRQGPCGGSGGWKPTISTPRVVDTGDESTRDCDPLYLGRI